MELSRRPFALSELIGRSVTDRSGRSLGRVFEVRAHWDGDGAIVLDELMLGRRAFLRRLRGPGGEARGIPWGAVLELGDDRIVVAGAAP